MQDDIKKEKNSKADASDKESFDHREKVDLIDESNLKEFFVIKSRPNLLEMLSNALVILGIISSIIAFTIMLASKDKKYVSKVELKNHIVSAVENSCDLRVIKNIYENRKIVKKGISNIFRGMDGYYDSDVPLSKLLEDIRSDYFIISMDKASVDRAAILIHLDSIIDEHLERNPFDALESGQKDYFENIRLKVGDKYDDIRNETDKLATELESKNALVTKYLNQASTSFWLSITALIFSLVIGLYQLFQGRSSRQKLLINLAISEYFRKKA